MMTKKVDSYFDGLGKWKSELEQLRSLLLSYNLSESLKWSRACYSFNDKLIVGLSSFKNHYGIWFFNGSLIDDKFDLLLNAQEGKTKGMRQIKFVEDSTLDIKKVAYYIEAAIKNVKDENFVTYEKRELVVPEALAQYLSSDKIFQKAFLKMSEYQKKEFAEYIQTAKRETTVQSRLEKIKGLVLKGEGLNDKYRK